jgi:hypothetical protein
MRRAIALTLLMILTTLAFAPATSRSQGQEARVINAIGLVDFYKKPTFKPGDWVRYHMTGNSALGAKDDYVIIVTIAGEEEFWGEECFWLETISVQGEEEIVSVASLMSYAVFDDPEAVTKMRTYVRKQISTMTETGEPVQDVMRRPVSTAKARDPAERKLEYYIDSLGTEEVEIDKGRFLCQKILFKQAAGASLDFPDSSRYDEVRENRTIYRNTQIPITSIVIEEVENIVARKTWALGQSSDAPMVTRDRALGRAVAVDWGSGRPSKIIAEALQKPLAQQRAEARRRAGRPGAG